MSFQVDKEHEVGFVYFIVISNINFGLYSNEYVWNAVTVLCGQLDCDHGHL